MTRNLHRKSASGSYDGMACEVAHMAVGTRILDAYSQNHTLLDIDGHNWQGEDCMRVDIPLLDSISRSLRVV